MAKKPLPHDDTALVLELEPIAGRALDAHLKSAEEWYPHQYVPWSKGTNFDGVLGGEPWDPERRVITQAARDGLLHNLLSEENLPAYHRVVSEVFGEDGAWGAWINRWTAEEGRHGMAIRDYLMVTRAADPVALEDARREHVQRGYGIDYHGDFLGSLIYVTLQELATRVSYRNIRKVCGDSACEALMHRIAQDENRHMLFYRTVLDSAMEIEPDRVVSACAEVIATFRSPGHGAPGFGQLALSMMRSGIYTPACHHYEVVVPLMRFLRVFDMPSLRSDGESSREKLAGIMEKSELRARRFASAG
ncbi:acyl-ACP desaturase [Streptomyces sp. MMG1121]|uniref:acyl-ACP desaturase n=1 Tax=Streptomyces sp. MMG1121 TaxID=1415544 RepID=UPI0006B064F0|nr:acyl-ACP desaturase [Streptomyces sp. MMG1121]KOV57972.1 acyl-ACP desaturase [Streptomyces sp. MMG1121]